MNDDIRRRVAALESRVSTEPVRLHMPDGKIYQIAGSQLHWDTLREFARMSRSSPVPVLNTGPARELQWLREAVRIEEPRGQLFALLAAMEKGGVPRGPLNNP